MKLKHIVISLLLAANIAWAGPMEDASSAYDRKDYVSAAKGLRILAEQGHARAQLLFGGLHLAGKGVIQDDAEAVKWFRLAAAQGHANAQYSLSTMYFAGKGVLKDNIRAHMWANVAVVSGNSHAAKTLDHLAKTMTSQQIGEAQKLARQCMAQNFKGCN